LRASRIVSSTLGRPRGSPPGWVTGDGVTGDGVTGG
jgi:hypothetical protein